MLNVLLNAYACNPYWGSEQGIGWHWSIELAKYCKVFVITEGEFRSNIETALANLPQKRNLVFIYNNVSARVRRMCWNQGDWRFYFHYRQWQKKTLKIAKSLCKEYHIDVIHQLNMQGFREPGLLWKIKGPKYVWGPVGGMSLIPLSYFEGESYFMKLFFKTKNTINKLQYSYQPNVRKAVQRSDVLLSSTPYEKFIFDNLYHRESYFVNDTGCDISDLTHCWNKESDSPLNLIWVAKFDFRKQLGLAIKTMAKLKELNIVLNIVGAGNNARDYEDLATQLGVGDKCIFWGKVEHEKVLDMMLKSDIFFFTSIHEASSTVILEAIGAKLPIVCFDTCGFGPVVDDTIGRKIPVSNPRQSVDDFSDIIKYLYYHRDLLPEMSENCTIKQRELSWGYKAEFMYGIYQQLIKDN